MLLPNFCPCGVGDEREHQSPSGYAEFLPDEVNAGGDVAILIGTADLQLTIVRFAQMQKIVRLQQHVAEFRIADAAVALELERTLSFASMTLTEKCLPISRRKSRRLTGAVHSALSTSLAGFCFESKSMNLASWLLMHLTLCASSSRAEQVAFGRAASGVADHAGGAAGKRDRVVTSELEAAQHELAHEVPDMEAVAGGIEAAVERDRPGGEPLAQAGDVGAIGDQSAPCEVFEKVHDNRAGYRGRRRRGQGESLGGGSVCHCDSAGRSLAIAATSHRWQLDHSLALGAA